MAVHIKDFPHLGSIQRIQVGVGITVVREIHYFPQDVGLAKVGQAIFELQGALHLRDT